MSNEKYNLSRRSVLGGIGAVGLTAAGAGFGTTAYLNDTESFEGNTITAGELDLRVDWQQKYYGPSEEWEFVNAHPDHDGDGEQSLSDDVTYSSEGRNIVEHLDCSNLDHDYDFGDQDTLVALDDVKPGDEGEITFSLHLCDNPGYIWLTADNFTESGGDTTEPENASLGDGDVDAGELAENMYVEFWYDQDCDNQLDEGTDEQQQELEVALVSDTSGSMSGTAISSLKTAAKEFVDNLSTPDEAAAISFTSNASTDQELTTDYQAVKDAIDLYNASGGTNIAAGISEAEDELLNGTNATSGANKVMILLSDGNSSRSPAIAAADSAKDAGIRIFTIALGSANTSLLEDIASSPSDAYVAPDPSDLDSVYSEIAQVVAGGESIILGKGDGVHDDHVTLAEAMEIMQRNGGMAPLDADGDMAYTDGGTAADRTCFEGEESYCIGAHWWVPTSVGNVIQDDSVGFDLGFYAEQCRHNDGSGPVTTRTGSGWAKQEADFNGDASISGGARARFGNNGSSGAWELAVGDEPGGSGGFAQDNYVWTSGEQVAWMVAYDAGTEELTFQFDGTTISDTLDDPQPDGRMALQAKADEGTVDATLDSLSIGGSSVMLNGPSSVTASNDGADRDLAYLVANTAFDGSTSFQASGTATVTLQGDYDGSQEGVAFDVVFE